MPPPQQSQPQQATTAFHPQMPHILCLLPKNTTQYHPHLPRHHQPSQEGVSKNSPLDCGTASPNKGRLPLNPEAGSPPVVETTNSRPPNSSSAGSSSVHSSQQQPQGSASQEPRPPLQQSQVPPGSQNDRSPFSNHKLCSSGGAFYCPSDLPLCLRHKWDAPSLLLKVEPPAIRPPLMAQPLTRIQLQCRIHLLQSSVSITLKDLTVFPPLSSYLRP